MTKQLHADICPPVDRPQALDILYQHLSQPARQEQIQRLLKPPASVSLDHLIVCKDAKGSVVGAMLCILGAGRVLMAWLPRILPELNQVDRSLICRELLLTSRRVGASEAARFIQLLADHVPSEVEPILLEAGYRYLTSLVFLRASVSKTSGESKLPPDVEAVPFEEKDKDLLGQILSRTYERSLDCPELTGVRPIEEVIDSHRGQGRFDPACWFLIRHRGQWAGCLLLNPAVDQPILELTYVGVVPEARGRGLGRVLMRHALRVAKSRGDECVMLAVDRRNTPALAAYEAEAFTPVDLREVYLRLSPL